MQLLKVLHLEDVPLDAQLLKLTLEDGFDLDLRWAKNKGEYIDALTQREKYDLVISDYNLPDLNAEEAFSLSKKYYPDLPFICVSGTIGEEKAVELLKMGVTDYILKDRTQRLVPAIKRALKEAEEQRLLEAAQQELRTQNEELRLAKNRAEESDRLKTTFLNNISHEIRTPITGIIGYSQLLINETDEGEKKKIEDVIIDLSDQLLSMVDNILKISAIDANQLRIEKSDLYLDDLLLDVYSRYNTRFIKKGVTLEMDRIPESLKKRLIYTDRNKLSQVLTSLFQNAYKFTNHGKVSFGVKPVNNLLRFYVKDTGVGIPEERQHLVFERFRQVDEGLSRTFDGVGLGLPISKAYVEALGGDIWFESGTDGTSFYFTIPNETHIIEYLADSLKD